MSTINLLENGLLTTNAARNIDAVTKGPCYVGKVCYPCKPTPNYEVDKTNNQYKIKMMTPVRS